MKRFAVLPLVALAFAAACSDSSTPFEPRVFEPVAPVGGPSFHHSSAIGGLKVIADDKGGVSASWTASLINDKPSNEHVVQLEGVETKNVGSATTYSKSGLTNGQKYRLRVTGHNGGKDGPVWSNWSEFTAYVAPAPPPAKKDQVVTITAPSSATYGDHAFAISAASYLASDGTTPTGLTVTLSVAGPCTLSAGEVTVTGAGNCVVTAEQAGNDSWNAAGAGHTIVVAKAAPTVTATGGTFTYDGTARAGSGSATGVGGVSLIPVTLSYKQGEVVLESAPVNAGTYTVIASYAGDANHLAGSDEATIQINKADQTITFGALGNQILNATFQVSATGGASGNPITFAVTAGGCTIDGNTVTASAIGSCTITASQAGNNNYNAAQSVPQSFSTGYNFVGFAKPVENNGVFNVAKAGQAIPLKWRLLDANGLPVTNLSSVNVSVQGLTCDAGATTDAVEEYASGSSGLQNLGDGYYQFNWKTPSTYASSCKTMKLSLGEAAPRTAIFKFTK